MGIMMGSYILYIMIMYKISVVSMCRWGWGQGPFIPLVSTTLTTVISREPIPVMLVCAAEFCGRFPMSNDIGPEGKEGVTDREEMSLTQSEDKLAICHCLFIITKFLEVDDHAYLFI